MVNRRVGKATAARRAHACSVDTRTAAKNDWFTAMVANGYFGFRPRRGGMGMSSSIMPLSLCVSEQAQSPLVGVEERVLLLAVGRFHGAALQHLADHLRVEAGGLGFGEDVLDVGLQRLALLLQPLDALHDGAQPVGGDAAGLAVVAGTGGHAAILRPVRVAM